MHDRYGAMFALRNRRDAEAAETLAHVLAATRSALLKHEVAYVLGQMQDCCAGALAALERTLRDTSEHPMVRHEAAEALGSIADESCVALLREHLTDPEPIVAESCGVALDILEFENSGEAEYCYVQTAE